MKLWSRTCPNTFSNLFETRENLCTFLPVTCFTAWWLLTNSSPNPDKQSYLAGQMKQQSGQKTLESYVRAAVELFTHPSLVLFPRLDLVPLLHHPQVWTPLHLPLRKETHRLPQRRPSSDHHHSKRHPTLSTSKRGGTSESLKEKTIF